MEKKKQYLSEVSEMFSNKFTSPWNSKQNFYSIKKYIYVMQTFQNILRLQKQNNIWATSQGKWLWGVPIYP